MPVRYRMPKKPPKAILSEKDLHVKKLRKDKPKEEENKEKLPDIWEKDMGEDENYQEWLEQQNKYSHNDIDSLIKKAFVDEDSVDYFLNKIIENIVYSSGKIDIVNPEFVTDFISLIVDDEVEMAEDVNINNSIDNNINVNLIKYNLNILFPRELRKKILSLDDSDENKKILTENFSEYIKQFKNEIDTIDWELQIDNITNSAFNGDTEENLDEVSDNLKEEKLQQMNTSNY